MTDISPQTWKDIFTIAAASIGAVLGIMNTWNSMSARKLRLKVTPQFVFQLDGMPAGASIEVINLSNFPVTVAEVGFDVGRSQHIPIMQTQTKLPHRLESREVLSVYFDPSSLISAASTGIDSAYVRTACGCRFKGNSSAGRQLGAMLSEIARGR